MFALRSENLTNLGGPMGTEYTYDNWVKYFKDVDAARAYAEKDYSKSSSFKRELKWVKQGKKWRTDDLGFVMYHISEVKTED